MKAAVIGHPITHSKSPLIHHYWMNKYNIKGSYEKLDIPHKSLKDGIRQLIDRKYTGFNVTSPHKESIITLCDHIDETARAIGAVNTVSIREGKLYGTNTDAYGFVENIKSAQPNFEFKDKKVVILGAGGAAQAILHGLLQKSVGSFTLINRTKEKAQKLQKIFPEKISICSWQEDYEAINGCDLLINATSLGMRGGKELKIKLDELPQNVLVCDIVYSPLMTDFLKQAKSRGNPIITGIGMLLHQAAPAFHLWTDVQPEITTELQELVLS